MSGCPALAGPESSGFAGKSQGTPVCACVCVCTRVCLQGPFGRTLPSGLCSWPWTSQALLSARRGGWDVCSHQAGAFFCLSFPPPCPPNSAFVQTGLTLQFLLAEWRIHIFISQRPSKSRKGIRGKNPKHSSSPLHTIGGTCLMVLHNNAFQCIFSFISQT